MQGKKWKNKEVDMKKPATLLIAMLSIFILSGATHRERYALVPDPTIVPETKRSCSERSVTILLDGQCKECQQAIEWFKERGVSVYLVIATTNVGSYLFNFLRNRFGVDQVPIYIFERDGEKTFFREFRPKHFSMLMCLR